MTRRASAAFLVGFGFGILAELAWSLWFALHMVDVAPPAIDDEPGGGW